MLLLDEQNSPLGDEDFTNSRLFAMIFIGREGSYEATYRGVGQWL